MDARLSAAGLVYAAANDNDVTFGRLELPWYGELRVVDVVFEGVAKDKPPTDRQIEAFCRFSLNRRAFFEALEGRLFKYYNDARTASALDKDTIERLFPPLDDQRQLKSLIDPTGLLVSYYDGEAWCDFIGILMECSWEREHGLGIKVVDEQVSEIGFQDIVL